MAGVGRRGILWVEEGGGEEGDGPSNEEGREDREEVGAGLQV